MPTRPSRASFRKRLTLQLGVALAVALTLIGLSAWAGTVVLLRHQAQDVLHIEIAAVEHAIVGANDVIRPEAYEWTEPHHRFASEHIDPYFLQVFDASGRLLRDSENIALLPPGSYPTRLLPVNASLGLFTPLSIFNAGGHRLYRVTQALRGTNGAVIGYVQLSRYAPPHFLGRLAVGLLVGLTVVLGTLLALVWAVGGRVVRPLQAITERAGTLSAQTLGDRVPVPPDADRETAALAAALNDGLERLDESFAEMRRFTANAAHELQTPLTVLLGHLEVALRRERDPDAYRQTLGVLQREVEGLVQTVRGLLALARLDGGSTDLPKQRLDLAEIVRAEADSARPRAESKGLDMVLTAPQPAHVDGNAALLREVVRNLIDNAIKYTEQGHIVVDVRSNGATVMLSVSDTGIGIDQPEHATSRFWRAPTVQHLPGSGLGLSLVERAVAAHGGRLTFSRTESGGTCVEAALPTKIGPQA